MPCESRPPAPNLPTVTDLGPLLFAARRSLACPEPSRRVANSFICHTSEIRARKSFNCHTSKNRACKSGSPSLSRSPTKKDHTVLDRFFRQVLCLPHLRISHPQVLWLPHIQKTRL